MSECQNGMHSPEPQAEHRWLERLVGEWVYEGQAPAGPGQPLTTFGGTESVRSVGGLWVVGDGRCPSPGGGEGSTLLTLGFDPLKQRFVGTFVASMMTHLWVYEGALDSAGRVLTLNTEGPDFADPTKSVPYRDVIELESDDHRILTSQAQGEDGAWRVFMTAHYRRKG